MTEHNSHNIEFKITQKVFVKLDKEQNEGVVISIRLLPQNCVVYGVSFGSNTDYYYGFKLSHEIDTVKKVM